MSILTRLVLLILLATVPAIGIQAYNEVALRRAGEERVADDARRLLTLIQDEQRRVVEGVREVLVTVAQAASLLGIEHCQSLFDQLGPELPWWKSLLLTDRDGHVRCATDPALVGFPIGYRPHVQAALQGDAFVVGDYVIRRANNKEVLPFAVPYTDEAGNTAGAAVLGLDIGWLEEYLARKPLPPNTILDIADRNGVLLARHPDAAGLIGRTLPPRLLDLLRTGASGVTALTDAHGIERVVAYAPVGEGAGGLFLVIGLDRGVALGTVEAATRRGALLIALAIGLVLLTAVIGARAVVLRPVARLMAAADRWRAGDFTARTGLARGGSELNRLAYAFDAMAAELQAREHAREDALVAERRTAAILASSTDGVIELDRAGRVTFINERAVRLFGRGGSPLGQHFTELLPATVKSLFRERFLSMLERPSPAEFETRFGEPAAWYAVRLFPAGDRLAVYVQDVTQRRQAERAIHAAEERHRAVLETAADAIVLLDAAGTIGTFNRAAERIFRYTAAEAVGRNIRMLIPGGLGALGDGIPGDEPRVIDSGREVDGVRRDGTRFSLEMGLAEWWDGGDRYFTAILRDITERKRIASALEQAKDSAERANQAKSRFLAAASHDLRQPVQSLFFFATALGDQIRSAPAVASATLESMQQALEALKRLLDGLLDISKLDAGVVEPVPAVIPLSPLLERLATEYRMQAARKGLKLRLVGTSLHVRSDPVLLERIVRNLLENALRYTSRGRILLGARRTDRHVRIVVCDSGIGIPTERQDEIFEEFTQIGNPERDREHGLGLGLAIVRRLCSLLDHPVALRSKPGLGSAFLVEVPRAAAPVAVAPVSSVAVKDVPGRQLVLVIDDEVIILMGLRVMLEGWGYDVLAAASGEEAIRLLEKDGRCPDVILADYRLRHGKTGPEALRAIHDHCQAPIPSIILTGDTAPERIVEAQRSGFSILHKPVSAPHLQRLVGEASGK